MKKIILFVISIFLAHISLAGWVSMGTIGGKVRTLCVHNNELYAGGDFTGLVKKWDNTNSSWVQVGNLSGTRVNTLYSYNGSLYAGGLFPIAGTLGNIAKLSGNTWVASGSGLGGGTAPEVKSICFYFTTLYAGGNFTLSGSTSVINVAKLNGANWIQAGAAGPSKCTGGVCAMMVYNSTLIVGGEGTAPFMNKLSPSNVWSEVTAGGPSDGTGVYAFGILNYNTSQGHPSLFVGGKFGAAGGFQKTIAVNTDDIWGTISGFSTGNSDQINCFASSSNNGSSIIYTGGNFTYTGTHTSTNIAKRINGSGVQWDSAGTPAFNAGIRALCFYNGYLVAGGDFTSPGSNVARYATTVGVEDISGNIIVNTVYPNPVISEALLKVQTKDAFQQPELKMTDISGNEISNHAALSLFNHAQNEVEFKIDREGLAAGIYYYMMVDGQRTIAAGKFIVE